jgi:mycobactin lysine-N-oxygenase
MPSEQTENPTVKTLVVLGAGPKAAAICAKAHVLTELRYPKTLRIVVIEQGMVANNWRGGDRGFTDGACRLGTPPEKDVGFPYNSKYGTDVDKAMRTYSWHVSKLLEQGPAYGDWVDRGRPHPQHSEWADYIDSVLDLAPPDQFVTGKVKKVVPVGGRLKIETTNRTTPEILADGIVFTGPGPAKSLPKLPNPPDHISDGQNYWTKIDFFKEITKARIAIVGGGETAASIAISLLDMMTASDGPVFDIDIINSHGTIFTRGESYRENRLFTNPERWKDIDFVRRVEIIKRTDRGVFSMAAQQRLNQAERLDVITGDVLGISKSVSGNKLEVTMNRGQPPVPVTEPYDEVILAMGFDPFHSLQLLPDDVRPPCGTKDERRELELSVDENLRISFAKAQKPPTPEPNVHMPMIAGLAQGPGYPNLSCLGHLADAILLKYIPPRRP